MELDAMQAVVIILDLRLWCSRQDKTKNTHETDSLAIFILFGTPLHNLGIWNRFG